MRTISRISGIPASVIDPFHNISYDERLFTQARIQKLAPIATIAVGLALRRTNET